MATFADITIGDSVPTNRTFTARLNAAGVAMYVFAHASGFPVADNTIKSKHTMAPKPDGITKNDWHITIPVIDAPASAGGMYTPAPRVIGTNELKLLSFTTGRGTTLDRANLVAFGKNLMSNSQYTDSVIALSPPRG